jgi:AcrR family transcriptional regulator
MTRPRTIDDDTILEAARRLISECGLRVTTRQIAEACGISEGVLFQRFGSKEGLIRAALALPEIDPISIIDRAKTGGDPCTDLQEVGVAIFSVFRRLLPLYVPLIGQPGFGIEAIVSDHSSPFMQLLRALEQHLIEERDAGRAAMESPHVMAFLIVSAIHNAAMFEALCGPMPQVNESAVRKIVASIWAGLEPRPENGN